MGQTGTQTGHEQISLHEALMELCKEKKMRFFKPTAYIDYVPAKLHDKGDPWYISYYIKDPDTKKKRRYRIKLNHIKPISERRKAARGIIADINEKLSLGWTPSYEECAPESAVKAFDLMDTFLKAKEKESEVNTMKSYRSYVKILKTWLLKKGFDPESYINAFTRLTATRFMNSVDENEKICAQTYNNYLRFYIIMFNWMKEKQYIADNPFDGIKRKSKKLTKKVRRTLTHEELEKLWTFLDKENKGFKLAAMLCYMCLMRPKEIVLLKCGDIDMERHVIHVRGEIAKNDNDSDRTIPDKLMQLLQEFDLSHPDWFLLSGKMFEFTPGPKQIWSQRITGYWDKHVRPACGFAREQQFYSLKDSGITNMISQGIPVSFVKEQADHSSLAMTSIYLGKSSEANQALRKLDL